MEISLLVIVTELLLGEYDTSGVVVLVAKVLSDELLCLTFSMEQLCTTAWQTATSTEA
jgi:hypothetical protein